MGPLDPLLVSGSTESIATSVCLLCTASAAPKGGQRHRVDNLNFHYMPSASMLVGPSIPLLALSRVLQDTTPSLVSCSTSGSQPLANGSQRRPDRWQSKISHAELAAIHQPCHAPLGWCIGPEMQIDNHSNQGANNGSGRKRHLTRAPRLMSNCQHRRVTVRQRGASVRWRRPRRVHSHAQRS
jgi:hypothetical protein